MINLSRNKKHKIRIKVTAILIAFMFLFENTGYCALDVARNKSTLRPPMAFSKETRKATVNRYDALLRKNEHEVQTVDPAITSSRTLRLRGERRSLDAGAEESKRSIEKLILMPGLNAEMQVKILMTQEELSELETFAHKVGDDNIATLFNKAIDVLALQGSNVSKLEKKSILLALIGSGESENLFEDGRDTHFIGINRTFFNIADLYPQVARILFIAGIARELRYKLGLNYEFLAWDAQIVNELLFEAGLTSDDLEKAIGPYLETRDFINEVHSTIRTTDAQLLTELLKWTILIEELLTQKSAQNPASFGTYIINIIEKASSVLKGDIPNILKEYGLIAPEIDTGNLLVLKDLVPAFRKMALWIQELKEPDDIAGAEQFGRVIYAWLLLSKAMESVKEIKDDKDFAELVRLTHKIEQTLMWIREAKGDVWVAIGDMDQLNRLNRLYGDALLGSSTDGPMGEIFSIVDNVVEKNKGFGYKYKAGDEFAIFSKPGATEQEMQMMLEDIRNQIEKLGLKYGAAVITNLSPEAEVWLKAQGFRIGYIGKKLSGNGDYLTEHSIIFELHNKQPKEALDNLVKTLRAKECPNLTVEVHPYNNGYFWSPTVSIGAISMKGWMRGQNVSYIDTPPSSHQLHANFEAVMKLVAIAQLQAKILRNRIQQIDENKLSDLSNIEDGPNLIPLVQNPATPIIAPISAINFVDPMTGLATNYRHKLVLRHILSSKLPWIHMARVPSDKIRLYLPNGDIIFIEAFYNGALFEKIPEEIKRGYRWTTMGWGLKAVNAKAGYASADALIKVVAETIQELWKEELIKEPTQFTIDMILDKLQARTKQKLHDSIEVRFRAFVVHAQDIGSNIEEAFRIQEQLRWAGDDHTALVNDTDQGNRILRYVPQLKAELEDAYNIWSWQDAEDAQEELVETVGVMHPALRQQAFMELSISQTARTNI